MVFTSYVCNAIGGTLPHGCAITREYDKVILGLSFLFFSLLLLRQSIIMSKEQLNDRAALRLRLPTLFGCLNQTLRDREHIQTPFYYFCHYLTDHLPQIGTASLGHRLLYHP